MVDGCSLVCQRIRASRRASNTLTRNTRTTKMRHINTLALRQQQQTKRYETHEKKNRMKGKKKIVSKQILPSRKMNDKHKICGYVWMKRFWCVYSLAIENNNNNIVAISLRMVGCAVLWRKYVCRTTWSANVIAQWVTIQKSIFTHTHTTQHIMWNGTIATNTRYQKHPQHMCRISDKVYFCTTDNWYGWPTIFFILIWQYIFFRIVVAITPQLAHVAHIGEFPFVLRTDGGTDVPYVGTLWHRSDRKHICLANTSSYTHIVTNLCVESCYCCCWIIVPVVLFISKSANKINANDHWRVRTQGEP